MTPRKSCTADFCLKKKGNKIRRAIVSHARSLPSVEDIFQKVTEVDGESRYVKVANTAGGELAFLTQGRTRLLTCTCRCRMLEIIDTAGQEEYKTLRDIYFKESDGFVLVYSITSPQSFVQAQKLKDRLTQIHGPGKPIILAGNKLDLDADRQVEEEVAYQYAVSQQVGFFECSAKEMINVSELFNGVVRLVDRHRKSESPNDSSAKNDAANSNNAAEGGGDASSGNNGRNGRRKVCVLL